MKSIREKLNKTNAKAISKETKEKCDIAKKYIESKYQKHFEEEKQKKEFYDSLIQRMQQLELDESDQQMIQKHIIDQEIKYLREKRAKESILDYEPLSIIGRGAFGEVRLCRHISGELVAVKKMSKQELNKKNQLNHIRAE